MVSYASAMSPKNSPPECEAGKDSTFVARLTLRHDAFSARIFSSLTSATETSAPEECPTLDAAARIAVRTTDAASRAFCHALDCRETVIRICGGGAEDAGVIPSARG